MAHFRRPAPPTRKRRAHYSLANILLALGRHEEAAGHYVETLRLKPDHADAHSELSFILRNKANPQ